MPTKAELEIRVKELEEQVEGFREAVMNYPGGCNSGKENFLKYANLIETKKGFFKISATLPILDSFTNEDIEEAINYITLRLLNEVYFEFESSKYEDEMLIDSFGLEDVVVEWVDT